MSVQPEASEFGVALVVRWFEVVHAARGQLILLLLRRLSTSCFSSRIMLSHYERAIGRLGKPPHRQVLPAWRLRETTCHGFHVRVSAGWNS